MMPMGFLCFLCVAPAGFSCLRSETDGHVVPEVKDIQWDPTGGHLASLGSEMPFRVEKHAVVLTQCMACMVIDFMTKFDSV